MLNGNDFKFTNFHDSGLGGLIQKATSKKDSSLSYVVKISEQNQSINEFVAQHLLVALGMTAVPAELIEIARKPFGAVQFVPDLKPISFSSEMTTDQINDFAILFTLSGLLNNQDAGEFFLMQDGKVCSLDWGETIAVEYGVKPLLISCDDRTAKQILASPLFNLHHQGEILERNFFTRFDMIKGKLGIEAANASIEALYLLSELDMDKMELCIKALATAFCPTVGEFYRDRLLAYKTASENLISSLEAKGK